MKKIIDLIKKLLSGGSVTEKVADLNQFEIAVKEEVKAVEEKVKAVKEKVKKVTEKVPTAKKATKKSK